MNTLSLIIYFSNAIPAITGLFVIAIIVAIITAIAYLILGCSVKDYIQIELKNINYRRETPMTKEEAEQVSSIASYMKDYTRFRAGFKKTVILLILIFPIPFILPSRDTILLIAASEMGENLVKHENVSKIVDPSLEFLSTWIKTETENLKTKTNEMKSSANSTKDKIVDDTKAAIVNGVKNKIDEVTK
jgi:hypothetical protein